MCLICVEFNRRQDIFDAERMVEAARRESNAISEKHLAELEERLREIKKNPGKKATIELNDEDS